MREKTATSYEFVLPIGSVQLGAYLHIPDQAKALIIFAHGSGSSRKSPRNQYVASYLQGQQFATLLLDLLTMEEEAMDQQTAHLRFDIPFLAERLVKVFDWAVSHPELHSLRIGLFGASTGAAAALIAAAEKKELIYALVSRGGRPDLAGDHLLRVKCPTLLIVGGKDYGVIDLNQKAHDLLACEKKLEIVPNATHLFEEHGALEEVARLAGLWFSNHL